MYFVEVFHCNCSTGTVTRCLFLIQISQGGAVLFAPPRKAVAFLTAPSVCQKHGTEISLPAGSDQGYSPTPRQHFWKIAGSKNFSIRLWLIIGNTALREKLLESGSARLGHIPSLPWESQLPLKPCTLITTFWFWRQLQFFHSPRFYLLILMQFDLLRKCGLLAHTSAAFLKNCCTEKLFSCLRLVICNL